MVDLKILNSSGGIETGFAKRIGMTLRELGQFRGTKYQQLLSYKECQNP